jgi:hypothetical protein
MAPQRSGNQQRSRAETDPKGQIRTFVQHLF